MTLRCFNISRLIAPGLIALAAVFTSIGFSQSANAYAQVRVYNFAPVPVTVNIIYAGCRHDTLNIPAAKHHGDKITPTSAMKSAGHYEQHHTHIWRWWKKDDPRRACLVTKIDASFHGKHLGKSFTASSYKSSGTGYSQFGIYQRSETRYRVMSNAEIKKERVTAHMSPGFIIHNRSTIPLTISLDQLGCLYYENNVKPGQTFDRNTGAVWFTIRAKLYDPKQRTSNWSCAKPILEVIGGAILSAATAGFFAAAEASSVAIAAGAGAIATGMAKKTLGAAAEANLEANTNVSLKGAYAGPPWPFRCKIKPEWEITGGPPFGELKGLTGKQASQKAVDLFTGKHPLRLRKINKCG
jgi:hypothetical protein